MAMRLVADVGGTNTRFGLAEDGQVIGASVSSYRNDDFNSFDAALAAYLEQADAVAFSEMAIAVAGPSEQGRAKLTNRDWHFDAAALSAAHDARVLLLNDLSALGHAVADGPKGVEVVVPASATPGNGQALVVGIGTGFNVAPVLRAGDQAHCLIVEYGHTSLPKDIVARVREAAMRADFDTVEDLFSGRGYRSLMESMGKAGFDEFYAELIGLLARNLRLAFLPDTGVYFAGGVARHVLESRAQATFVETYQQPFTLEHVPSAPVYILSDDTAALVGCAKVCSRQAG